MKRRGRPPASVPAVRFHIQLRLYPGVNDALIAYLQAAPPRLRSQYVLQALQTGSLPGLASPAPANAEPEPDFDGLLMAL